MPLPPALPTHHGISPSCVWLPTEVHATLLDFLVIRFHEIPQSTWQARLTQGLVLNQDGQAFAVDSPYVANQHIYYYRHIEAEPRIPFDARILYQDDDILVADKPHFLPVIPSGKYVQETLLTRLKNQTGIDTLAAMHRIDRETAGLVLFCKRPEARDAYQALFRLHQIEKTYEAIVAYRPLLRLPLTYRSRMVKGEPFYRMQEVDGEPNSETHIALMNVAGNYAKYQLKPVSGKQHQLRVHLAALGIPILNDPLYPEQSAWKEDYAHPLQLLARELRFVDPLSQQSHCFRSELDLQDLSGHAE
jgi:tRNA pseudouridine32 synthase/23S rRNA pseudouridine746 synthase